MQLTAVEFAKIITDLKCDIRPDERRQNPRAPTRSRVDVILVTKDGPVPRPVVSLRVRDISRNGLGLVASEHVEEGRRMLVLLPKTQSEVFVLLCEVARVTRLPADAYGIGVRMVRRVSEQERQNFMRGQPDAIAALLSNDTPAAPAAEKPAAAAA